MCDEWDGKGSGCVPDGAEVFDGPGTREDHESSKKPQMPSWPARTAPSPKHTHQTVRSWDERPSTPSTMPQPRGGGGRLWPSRRRPGSGSPASRGSAAPSPAAWRKEGRDLGIEGCVRREARRDAGLEQDPARLLCPLRSQAERTSLASSPPLRPRPPAHLPRPRRPPRRRRG